MWGDNSEHGYESDDGNQYSSLTKTISINTQKHHCLGCSCLKQAAGEKEKKKI